MNLLQRRQRICVEGPHLPPPHPTPCQAIQLGKECVKPSGHHQSEEWECKCELGRTPVGAGYCPKGYGRLLDRIWKICSHFAASVNERGWWQQAPAGFLLPPSPGLGCRLAPPCLAFHASAELPTSVSCVYSKHSHPLSHLSSV